MTRGAKRETPSGKPKAGWYPDPDMPQTRRYWDGDAWTDHVAPAEQAGRGVSTARIAMGVASGIALVIVILTIVGSFSAQSEIDRDIQQLRCQADEITGTVSPDC